MKKGEIRHRILHVDFLPKDLMQVIVGASILAVPVGFTQEVWELGSLLPWTSILGFFLISIFFISLFVYLSYYKNKMEKHNSEFFSRVIGTYVASFILVGVFLALILKAPWTTDFLLAFKRTILVTFPCSLSATVVDTLH